MPACLHWLLRASMVAALAPTAFAATVPAGQVQDGRAQDELSRQASLWSARPDPAAFDKLEEEHLQAAQRAIARLKAARGARTLANTLAPFDAAILELNSATYFAALMEAVHPDAGFRDHATAMTRKVSAARTAISLDHDLYQALASLDLKGADAATRHYVQRQLLQFRLAGVDKDERTRTRLKELQDQLTELQSKFERNINDGTKTVIIKDLQELDGLPPDFISRHKAGDDGLVRISTDYPDYYPVMQFASSEPLRRRLMTAFDLRAYPENGPVMRGMMKTRHEIATLLGYPSWADYNAADSMVHSGARIARFIGELDTASAAGARREFEMLLEQKQRQDPGAREIGEHEAAYLRELVRRARYDFDSQSVRPYFPYTQVKQGILDVAAALFGVQFRRDASAPAWDPSVEVWNVYDHGKPLGRIYLDMYPRPGKFSHAEMMQLRDGVLGRQLPEAALICNFPPPTATDPGLMVYSDVESFFHEFGHLMHGLLAGRQAWAGISGITMESDFVEAPSQMLEELLRSPAVLARFARHHQTQAPIPAELVERMNRAATFGRASFIARQNVYTALSYELYRQDPAGIDPDAVEQAAKQQHSLYQPLPGTHEWASFGHLAGYSSAYYTYMWDKVIALDFFSRFDPRDPLAGAEPQRYRRAVLEPGGAKPADDLVKEFLGRPQNMEAFTRWIGEEFARP